MGWIFKNKDLTNLTEELEHLSQKYEYAMKKITSLNATVVNFNAANNDLRTQVHILNKELDYAKSQLLEANLEKTLMVMDMKKKGKK